MKRKIKISVCFLILGFQGIFSQKLPVFFEKTNTFLNEHVKEGRVDYNTIKKNPEDLKELIKIIEEISIAKVDANTYKAFYINSYNLLVVSAVIENYPLKSPLDVPGFFDKKKYKVAQQEVALNQIENELLRAKFPKEPRFHFVLVCAGLGCPPIINKAYLPNIVNTQMEYQTEKALNDEKFIRINGGDVNVSQIFEWYKEDFEKAGGILYFINEYREQRIPASSRVGFYPYDWTLNTVN